MKYIFLFLIGAFSYQGFAQESSVTRNWGGGVIISQDKYPAVIQIEMNKQGSTGTGFCTATVVGPNTILTASHCAFEKNENGEYIVPENKTGSFTIANKKYNFKFIANVKSAKEIGADKIDVALGITDQVIDNVNPMTINMKENTSKKMIAVGYGCAGYLPSETYLKIRNESVTDRFLISNDDSMDVFACGGDSGGPTFAYDKDLKLQLVGVHIRSDLKKLHWDLKSNSFLFIQFIMEKATANDLQICGFNLDCI